MSRVDEALRRAAGEIGGATAAADTITHAAVDPADVERLTREPFPSAAVEPIRHLVAAPAAASDGDGTEDDGPRETRSHRRRGAGAPLFERIDGRLAEKIVADPKMDSASREQYRRLAAVLHDAQAYNGVAVVMMASAVPGEGKTLTAANLALTLSESYHRRVLLIDADLRKPALHNVFKVNTSAALDEGLYGDGAAKLVVRQLSPRLSLLPAGRPTSDPMAGLTSERMRTLVQEARESFDWVILDTPPLVMLPDANLLASMVDGAVLVVRANSTPHHLVARAVEAIGNKRILGVVLNQASAAALPYDAYYHAYYSAPRD